MVDIVDLLPDIPRWVEARHLVLKGEFEAFGLDTKPSLSVALRDCETGGAFVVGRPSDEAVLAAVAGSKGDLIAGSEATAWLAELLPGWDFERAVLYRAANLNLPDLDGDVRLVDMSTIERFVAEPDLLEELRDAADYTEIAASFVGEQPVAFCYSGTSTETLWDVSIDTLEAFRRQGHAKRVAAFMIRRMEARGFRTLWGSLVSNTASWRLAQTLGFVPVDEIVIFQR